MLSKRDVIQCPHCDAEMEVYDDLPSALAELKRNPGCRLRLIVTEPESVTLYNAERERARGYFDLLAQRYGRECLQCERTTGLLVDHIIPLSRGGTSDIENLQILCTRCNLRKGVTIVDYRPFPFGDLPVEYRGFTEDEWLVIIQNNAEYVRSLR